jgi:Uma2 family endonuclease
MTAEPRRKLSPQEYLEIERKAEIRSEYLDGEMFAMSGASRKHGRIALNTSTSLHSQLRDRPCETFAADMRVRVSQTGLYTYPDIVVVCDPPQFEDSEIDTLLNPTLIVEVLSSSTTDYDRGTKFAHYRTLSSFREYLLLAQDRVHAEHFVRQAGDRWLLSETDDPTAVIDLVAIGCKLPLADAYARVFP